MCKNCKAGCWKIGALVVAGIAVLGWVVMALWTWLVPSLFAGAHEIDYLHALGLLVLSKILFGGFRGHCGWHGRCHHYRCEQMSPEEREKWKGGMCGCWGCCCSGKQEEAPKE